jgi:hypothetical protein
MVRWTMFQSSRTTRFVNGTRTLYAVCGILVFGCTSLISNDDAAVRLANASQPTAFNRKLIANVLQDVLQRNYRRDDQVRKYAFYAIARMKLTDLLPSIRSIAAMQVTPEPLERGFLDIVAIAGALDTLAEFHDARAEELNRARIVDSDLRVFAVMNLRRLHAWNATRDVTNELLVMALTDQTAYDVEEMLQFLSASPMTDSEACRAVDRVKQAYPRCKSGVAVQSFCSGFATFGGRIRASRCD